MTYNEGNNNRVEYTNCFFKLDSTCSDFWISSPSVNKAVTIMHTIIPAAGMRRMKRKFLKSNTSWRLVIELPPITKAAHVDSAKEPNKSAPMPATSPTLSPTLSAIVAGFLGLS